MKKFKRIQALFLTLVMALMTFGTTTAFAATAVETEAVQPRTTRAIEILEDYSGGITTSRSAAGQAFTSTSNELRFEINYSATNTIVAVRLHDQTTGSVVGEWQDSSGDFYKHVQVTKGHTYIFEYLVAYGSGTVYVTNTVYAVFRD